MIGIIPENQEGNQSPPLKKGYLGGFSMGYIKIPPGPPFSKGGNTLVPWRFNRLKLILSSKRCYHQARLLLLGQLEVGTRQWPELPTTVILIVEEHLEAS